MRIVFFGSPDFAVPSLAAVAERHEIASVVTQPDRPAGRGKKLQPPAVKAAAARLGLAVLQPDGVRSAEVLATLRALSADLFVVVAYGRILPQALLDAPRLGAWNIHASLLPQLRGAAPIQWAIIRGETRTGVSIMRMEAGLDTGPIAATSEEAISEDDTAATLSERLAVRGADLLAAALPHIADGSVRLAPQDEARATLAPILRKTDGRLDFTQEAHRVACRARGVDPWPGAWATLDGVPLKLFRPRVVAGAGRPGEVLGLRPEGLAVACAAGAVAFEEVQLPGRNRLFAAAVVAGHPLAPGSRLA